MKYFPFFENIEGKKVLIVGGGKLAYQKVCALMPFHPDITIEAPVIFQELQDQSELTLVSKTFEEKDLDGFDFIIAATNDKTVNQQISCSARELKMPVNVVDDRELSTFIFPALVNDGDLTVAVSTGGDSPAAARWLKEKILGIIPPDMDEILSWLDSKRETVLKSIPDQKERSRLFYALLGEVMEKGRPLSDEEWESFYHFYLDAVKGQENE